MNKASLMAALIAGGMSLNSLAAELNIPLSMEFIAVNGQEVKSNFFSHKDELELEKGKHTVALVYKDLIEEPYGDGHQRVNSDPFLLHITIDADGEYKLRPETPIRDLKQAKAFAKDPKVSVTHSGGQQVQYSIEMTSIREESIIDTLTKELTPEQKHKQEVIAATAPAGSATNAAVATTATVATSAVAATAPSQSKPANQAQLQGDVKLNPEAMLKYWWQQADEKTRKEFMTWAISNM
ncbi:DUF2057 domain-containing protein [Ferrimonas sp. YFM]|uniref:YccT family protein n=1 Tax=Ferrimonas sp. YFM TaxID=3028878 RepID=UPI0025734288|nr:DUF2057 domain-containing protein [Ferrimonas sp. YFM]BDY05889.1 UPF0319 protein [Ferrimonas sp. YFM]